MKTTQLIFAICFALAAFPVIGQEEEACATAPAQVESAAQGEAPELVREGDLSDQDLERVVEFMVAKIQESGGSSFTREEIHQATGVVVMTADSPLLQAEVFLKLEDLGIDALAGSRCADYGACSLYGDLSGATGEILTMYEREKKEDGRVYSGTQLPEFTAYSLTGDEVHSAALRGHRTVLAFLAVHCRHSLDSLPILDRLTEDFGDRGLKVVGVYINSGSHQDVAEWLPELEPQFEVWVRNDDELGDLFSGHLVPTYFLIDEQGQIEKKLVGFKEESEVLAEVTQWVPGTAAAVAAGR